MRKIIESKILKSDVPLVPSIKIELDSSGNIVIGPNEDIIIIPEMQDNLINIILEFIHRRKS